MIFYYDQSKRIILLRAFCLIFKSSKTKLLDFPPLCWNPRHLFAVEFDSIIILFHTSSLQSLTSELCFVNKHCPTI